MEKSFLFAKDENGREVIINLANVTTVYLDGGHDGMAVVSFSGMKENAARVKLHGAEAGRLVRYLEAFRAQEPRTQFDPAEHAAALPR